MNKNIKQLILGLFFCAMALFAIVLLGGCGENPAGPEGKTGPAGPAGTAAKIMTRGFPVSIMQDDQNSVCPITGIKVTPMNGVSQVTVYVKFPNLEHLGWLALPYTMTCTDGSTTRIQYSIDNDKLMIQNNNTNGNKCDSFQAYAVIINK